MFDHNKILDVQFWDDGELGSLPLQVRDNSVPELIISELDRKIHSRYQ